MRFVRSLGACTVLACVSVFTRPLMAAGLELLPAGNQSVARGGAVTARAEDPMVIANDPAGLAFLSGHQILLDVITPIHRMCVDPYGYYGWGAYGSSKDPGEFGDPLAVGPPGGRPTYATTPLPEVCNSAKTFPLPELAWAGKLTERLGVGVALVAVPVGVPGLQYGGTDGTVQTPNGARPTPTRYGLIKQELTKAFGPSVAAGFKIIPQLSVGMTLQVLMAQAQATAAQNAFGGTQPSSDWLATLKTQDYFIPSITVSVHAKPVRPVDLVVVFHYTEQFHGSGDVTYETNTFHRGATSGIVPNANPPIPISDIRVGLPWQLNVGARYAGLLSKKTVGGLGDPMDTELWDLELDLGYSLNGLARNSVDVGHSATVETREFGKATTKTTADVSAVELDPHRKTGYTARLGGSFSVIPRELQVHAGGFFESRSVEAAYADVDSFAFQRIGVGLGGVIRLGSFDLRAAYSHIFSETLEITPPPHQNVENASPSDPRSGFDKRIGGSFGPDGTRQGGTVLEDPSAPRTGDAVAAKTQRSAISTQSRPERVINAGKYTASFDVISVGVAYHF